MQVYLPARMQKAGRVDFVLKMAPLEAEEDDATADLSFLYGPAIPAAYERFDPYNQFARYSVRSTGERGLERQENPWWFSYFARSTGTAPNWLLKID